MADAARVRWLVTTPGHWFMVFAAWIIALVAGDRLIDALRGEGGWFGAAGFLFTSVITWLACLRTKQAPN